MKLTLSLGSNFGDPKQNLIKAVNLLVTEFPGSYTRSRYYQSPPYGPQDQNDFFNIALEIDTEVSMSPFEVLKV